MTKAEYAWFKESHRNPDLPIVAVDEFRTAHAAKIRRDRNAGRRMINSALRELCGTSAAAARRDMGM